MNPSSKENASEHSSRWLIRGDKKEGLCTTVVLERIYLEVMEGNNLENLSPFSLPKMHLTCHGPTMACLLLSRWHTTSSEEGRYLLQKEGTARSIDATRNE